MLVEFVFNIRERKLRSPDRNVQLRKHPRQGADVVFVAMREHDCAHAMPIFGEIGNIGYDDIDAQQFGFGEHHAGVHDDHVIAPAHGHAVHSELAEAAERHQMEFS